MTPVEATSCSLGGTPAAAAARSDSSAASRRPASPVATLALPATTTMARAVPAAARGRDSSTLGPEKRLRVKTPALVHGPSERRMARSWRGPARPARSARPSGAASVGSASGWEADQTPVAPAWATNPLGSGRLSCIRRFSPTGGGRHHLRSSEGLAGAHLVQAAPDLRRPEPAVPAEGPDGRDLARPGPTGHRLGVNPEQRGDFGRCEQSVRLFLLVRH